MTYMLLPRRRTTVRVQDGKTLTTDDPFVEIEEAIGGYPFFVDVPIELPAPSG